MANFGNIIEWVLRLEDRTLAGKTENLNDGAGLTRFGLTTRDEGDVLPRCFWEDDDSVDPVQYRMSNLAALEAAKQVYYDKYWTPICCTQIASDEVAATLLSFAVNDGIGSAVKLLQGVLGLPEPTGHVGPWTLQAISALDPSDLAERLRDAQEARYLKIEAEKPADVQFDAGWRKRAYARYPDLPA
jgi:lysozyme family protein